MKKSIVRANKKDKATDYPKQKPHKNQPKNTTKKIRRISRPMGLTQLCKEYKGTQEPNLLYQIQKIVANDWAYHNFYFMGKTMTIEQIAKLIHWTEKKVIQHIANPIKNWVTGNNLEDNYRALMGFCLKLGLADRTQFQSQIQVLTESQGGIYKAFISDAVTKSLGLLDQNTRTLTTIINSFKPDIPKTRITNQVAVMANGQSNPQTEHGKYIGANEAVKLLEANRPDDLLQSSSLQDAVIADSIGSEALPEVIATKQQGLDITGHDKPVKKRLNKAEHSARREEDGPILSSPIIIP